MTRGTSSKPPFPAPRAVLRLLVCARRALPGLLACLCLAAPRSVQAADNASDCPRQGDIVAALGQVVATDGADAAVSEIAVRDLGASWHIEVRGRASTYAEPARNCAERARVAAVFAALVLAPPDRDEDAEAATSSDQAASRSYRLPLTVELAPLLAVAAGANVPLGGGGQLRIAHSGQHLGLAGGAEATAFSKLDAGTYGASVTRIAFDVSAREAWSSESLGFAAELGPYLALLRVRGTGLYENGTSNHVDAGGRAAFTARLRGRLAPFMSVQAALGARRVDLVVDPGGTLGHVPRLWLGLSAGVALDL
jgi:hypothetical protein